MMMRARRFLKTVEVLSGIIALTRALAREPVPDVLVNVIAPGAVGADMTRPASMTPACRSPAASTRRLPNSVIPKRLPAWPSISPGQRRFHHRQCFGVNGGRVMH